MNLYQLPLLSLLILLSSGCGSDLLTNVASSERTVQKVDPLKIDSHDAATLARKWTNNEKENNSNLTNDIVQIKGKILSITSHENGVLTVVIGESSNKIACHFSPKNWPLVGNKRALDRNATITLIGELNASSIMAPEACIATGCRLISSDQGTF